MRTLSLDLRERILLAYDQAEGNREEIAERFCVSLGMVKKLLQQRRATGDVAPRHRYSGRKPLILPVHCQKLRAALNKKSDLTLAELRETVAVKCSLPALHYALAKMGLTYKKRHSALGSRSGGTSARPGGRGANGSPAWIPPG
jgi:transposase